MIKLATVFSGIGAIEHALKRMGVQNKIVFACDNGDVEILKEKIDTDLIKIGNEFAKIKEIIEIANSNNKEESRKIKDLTKRLKKNKENFEKISMLLVNTDENFINVLLMVLKKIVNMPSLKKVRFKEYSNYISEIESVNMKKERMFLALKFSLKILNDFKKDNKMEMIENPNIQFSSRDQINWSEVIQNLIKIEKCVCHYNAFDIVKSVKDIAERIGMLYEDLKIIKIKQELNELKSYEERKKYIDDLYESKKKSNNVRKSYLANYEINEKDFQWNVSFLEGKHYQNNVDLFVGGSPCQSFSLVGKQRGLEDTRGTLFYEYARLVKEIKPKIFIYENVKAVKSNDNGNTWETMQKVFTDLNYNWHSKVLNSRDYGIPQNRERIFVVGFRNDLVLNEKFEFPKAIGLNGLTMKDFLMDNVAEKYYLPPKGVKFVTSEKNLQKRYTQIDGEVQLCQKKNQQFNWHGDFVFVRENKDSKIIESDLEKYFLSEKVKKYVLSSGTKGFYSKPKIDLDIARPLLTTMHKMHRAGVDNYVTTDGRLRKLTPRECLRLMGFCDSFNIEVSDTAMYQQAGNSIVVDVLIEIMNQILKSYPMLGGE